MLRIRVIPCLLLQKGGLVKTERFKDPRYVGDPINAVRIFNEKEVDELVFLDISASKEGRGPNLSLVEDIAGEAFMPFAYGGGIRQVDDAARVIGLGVEKVVLNSQALANPDLIEQMATRFGSQSVVVAIDVKRNWLGGYEVLSPSGRRATGRSPEAWAREVEERGAGEIFLTAIDRDGTRSGYDIPLVQRVTNSVGLPVIASGGAGKIDDFITAVRRGGASAVAAGSLFVFHGKHRAVLITYPSPSEMEAIFQACTGA